MIVSTEGYATSVFLRVSIRVLAICGPVFPEQRVQTASRHISEQARRVVLKICIMIQEKNQTNRSIRRIL